MRLKRRILNYFSKVSKQQTFYWIAVLGMLLGFSWILYNLLTQQSNHFTVCIVKNVTGIPCPSCGSTRSLFSLISGDFSQAWYYNPIGYLYLIVLILGPIWLLRDMIYDNKSLYYFTNRCFAILKRKPIFIGFVLLVLINWFWNIIKFYA